MQVLETGMSNAEKIVQQRVEKSAGVMRGEPSRRFNRDDDQPQNRGNPRFQDLVAVLGQSCVEAGWDAGVRRPRDDQQSGATTLFNGIIRGFARDHDVVNVTLAQAGAADAHETRLLQ